MRNKLILFLMLALFGSTGFLRADELTVHDETGTSAYVPVYGFYADAYLKCEMVYPADELAAMNGGVINGITFYATSPATEAWGSTFQVFMTEVESTSISDFAGPDVASIVYEGVLDGTASAMAITFSAPYHYTGGNLLIGVYNITKGTYKSITWAGESVDGASVQGYSYSDLGSISPTQRNFLPKTTFDYTAGGPVPPTPTGEIVITPTPMDMMDRALNGWSEPLPVRIYNGGETTMVEATLSGSYDENPFYMIVDDMPTMQIEAMTLATGDALSFDLAFNDLAPEGEYIEEFSLFYAGEERNIMTVAVTGNLYTAVAPDIVEVPGEVVFAGGEFEETLSSDDLKANYNLYGMTQMEPDAVYHFSLADDYHFHAAAGDDFIAVYNVADVDHLTADVEPVIIGTSGIIDDEILLAGDYYLVIASNNISNVTMNIVEIPAPEAIIYVNPSPADGAMNVAAPVTLAWEGGANATEYQVLFGTVYPPTQPVLDWTIVDEDYGEYTINTLLPTTQYFWQINVRNSHGTVEGDVRGFTSTIVSPHAVTASATEIFTDESTLIKWKLAGQGGFEGEITVCDGTTTSSYIPVYGLWMDDYTRGEMIYPAEMLEEMEGGSITSLTYYISSAATGAWSGDVFNVYLMEVDNATLSSYYTSANATIVYTGALDGQGTTMVINFDEPYTYDGGNLLVGIEETVCGTYKSCSFYGVDATGASASGYSSSSLSAVTFDQRNFLPKTTFTCGGARNARDLHGFNVYYGDVKANDELILERQYLLENLPYNMDGHEVTVTAVYDEGESLLSDPVIVYVSGYGELQGHVNELISGSPVAGANVKFTGKDEFNNNVSFEGTTNTAGFYTINNVKAGNYTGIATLEGNEPAHSEPVTLAYNTTEVVDFIMHETYNPVFKVYAQELDPTTAKVTWSLYDFVTPTPGGSGGGTGDEFFENLDNGALPTGWTMIDADGDGYNWKFASTAMGTGYGHNGSTDCILSQSYDNNYGVLYPNNYLVTSQVNIGSNSTFSFFACAQDASYAAEHFGVAVSTTTPTASEFTMVEEWTMSAKGSGVMAPGRDGQTRAQGSWHEYTVDLSAYAGQQVYIAIRHFNCSDMFYLDVDDIALSNSSKNRSVETYAVYRKAILKEAALVEADSVFFGCVNDTLYADFDWDNVEPGLYQYGVSAHYPMPRSGNRDEVIIGEPTGTDGYLPCYTLYNYSCTNQIYTGEEIGGAGTINSIAFFTTNAATPTRNLNIYMVNSDKTSFTSGSDWTPVTDADLVYSGVVTWTANDWTTIQLANPFDFDGSNLIVVVNDLSGSWSSTNQFQVFTTESNQAIRIYQDSAPYNPSAAGSGSTMTKKNVIKLDITYGGGGGNDNPVTPITWSNILPKDMGNVVTVNAHVAAGTAEGATLSMDNTFENLAYRETFDETGTITFPEFRKGNYVVTVDLEGYTSDVANTEISIWGDSVVIDAYLTEIFKPVDALMVSNTGYARWTAVVPVDRIAERYFVTLDGALVAETTDNFIEFEGLEEGETYTAGVAVVYTTGMSNYVYKTFTYTGCDENTQVEDLEASNEIGSMEVVLTWNGGTPNPNPNPNPNPTGDTYDFENGLQGWTTIDGGSPSGYGWHLGSNTLGTGYGHNGSADLVISQSYDNNYGVIYPDNYLISPAKGAYNAISFWACAQDASYAAEHFGVAVSTTSATASAFTMVQEWTIGSKGDRYDGPRGQRAQSTWTQYTVDLSAYAGQEIWVAIRHFNCSDMFYLDVDDITLGTDSKRGLDLAAAGHGFGTTTNTLADDGNWYYYDNGNNSDAIGLTSGGGFYWGIMLPAGQYEGSSLTKIAYFDYTAHSGQIMIYNGGTSAPGTLLHTQSYTVSGTETYLEIEMDEAVEIDPEQNVWVVMHNNSGQYVASIDNGSGITYGSCISTDGATWYSSISSASGGQIDGNWNLRAYIEDGAPAPGTANTYVANKYNILVDGVVVGFTNGNTFTYECPDYDEHFYEVVYVDANYNVSCPAIVAFQILPLGVNEANVVNAIYPNPTSGDLHINAEGMNRITIVNTVGQVVYDHAMKADETVINMAQFGNGVYMVRIATENGTNVKRVVVNK